MICIAKMQNNLISPKSFYSCVYLPDTQPYQYVYENRTYPSAFARCCGAAHLVALGQIHEPIHPNGIEEIERGVPYTHHYQAEHYQQNIHLIPFQVRFFCGFAGLVVLFFGSLVQRVGAGGVAYMFHSLNFCYGRDL